MTTVGIGSAIRSGWDSREWLTPFSRTPATIAAGWFFPTGDAPAQAGYVSSLSGLSTGWTGTVDVALGTSYVTIGVPSNTSAVEVLDKLCKRATRALGVTFSWSFTTLGCATITTSSPFQMVFTAGTLATRLGFAGVYAGNSSYTGTVVPSTLVPSVGLRLEGADTIERNGGVALANASGFYSVPGITRTGSTGTLTLYGSFSELCDLLDSISGTYDVNLAGRWAGRVRTTSSARNGWGLLASNQYVEVDVTGVTL